MPIDTHKQLQDLLRTAEAFRSAMIQSGAVHHVRQSSYLPELRALESALQPLNYRIIDQEQTADRLQSLIAYLRRNPPVRIESGLHHRRELAPVDGMLMADALESWSIVEQLRAPEGAGVILFCDNPEPIAGTSPNNAIEVCDDWTEWKRRRFEGDSILDALRGARAARDAHVEIEKVRNGR